MYSHYRAVSSIPDSSCTPKKIQPKVNCSIRMTKIRLKIPTLSEYNIVSYNNDQKRSDDDEKSEINQINFSLKISPNWMTKFIIHGFIDTPLSNWVSDMRDELIIRGSLNVIVVDWAGGSLPLYTQVRKIKF